MTAFTRSRKGFRLTWLDFATLAAIVGFAAWFGWRVSNTMDYEWNWPVVWQYLLRYDETAQAWVPGLITQGLLTTIRLSLWTMVFATVIGTAMGICRTARGLLPRMTAATYVGAVRNTPPLVLIYIFYFFLADILLQALGIEAFVRALPTGMQDVLAVLAAPVPQLPNFLAALLTMAIYEGAFITEHVRAGIQSVEQGQHEAAFALGLSRRHEMQHVILPQAVGRIIPPLAGQFISTIKDTAIVSIISVQELTFQGMELLAATYMTFEIMITVTVLYLAVTLTFSMLARKVELRFRRSLG